MRKTPTFETTQRVVRASICSECPNRPRGSETWSSDQPRPCEGTCRLFVNLPRLRDLARQLDPMLGDPRDVIARHIQKIKTTTKPVGAGKKPADGLTRRSHKIVNILDRLYGF